MRKTKKDIGELAAAMLDGTIHYLEGAQAIAQLRDTVGAYANDPDFMPFVAILSEIRTLPFDTDYEGWSNKVSEKEALQIANSLAWAKDFSWEQCRSLAERYSVNL